MVFQANDKLNLFVRIPDDVGISIARVETYSEYPYVIIIEFFHPGLEKRITMHYDTVEVRDKDFDRLTKLIY